jgi:hypothetical protein
VSPFRIAIHNKLKRRFNRQSFNFWLRCHHFVSQLKKPENDILIYRVLTSDEMSSNGILFQKKDDRHKISQQPIKKKTF